MVKRIIVAMLASTALSCAMTAVAVLEAQSLPVSVPFAWDPSPSGNVVSYVFTSDGGNAQTVQCCAATAVFDTAGQHTVAVVAEVNVVDGSPTSGKLQSDPATLTFVINQRPAKPTTFRFK